MSLFVGRRDELARLADAIAVGLSGGVAAAVVVGEAGSGKSRLLVEASREVLDADLFGMVGYEPESPVPLAAAAEVIRRLAEGPATLHELTQLLGLAKSTVHGHLLVLRTGGLVVADVSRKTGYRLRRETLAESAALLETYLEGTEDE